jgi:hypothetical protein
MCATVYVHAQSLPKQLANMQNFGEYAERIDKPACCKCLHVLYACYVCVYVHTVRIQAEQHAVSIYKCMHAMSEYAHIKRETCNLTMLQLLFLRCMRVFCSAVHIKRETDKRTCCKYCVCVICVCFVVHKCMENMQDSMLQCRFYYILHA